MQLPKAEFKVVTAEGRSGGGFFIMKTHWREVTERIAIAYSKEEADEVCDALRSSVETDGR